MLAAGFVVIWVVFVAMIELNLGKAHSDLDLYFWPAAEEAAHGHALLIYSAHSGLYPNANGPTSYIPLTLVALLANFLGWTTRSREDILTVVIFSFFGLLMAREAVAVVVSHRGTVRTLPYIYAAFLLGIPFWVALASYGHIEQPIELWLTLLAIRSIQARRVVLTGALLGLVLLTRSSAAVAVATLLVTVAWIARQEGNPHPWKPAAVAGLTTVGTVLIGLSPFLLGNFKDTVFSLLTYRGALPVAGGSFWGAFASTSLGNIPRHFDAEVFMLAALLILGFVLFHTRRVHLDSAKLCGLLALTTICVPIFSKTTWGYYLLDPYVFVTIWALSRPGPSARRFVAPALLTILSVVLAFSRPVVPAPLCQIVEGVVISALLGGVLIWLVVDYIREAPRLESSPSAKS